MCAGYSRDEKRENKVVIGGSISLLTGKGSLRVLVQRSHPGSDFQNGGLDTAIRIGNTTKRAPGHRVLIPDGKSGMDGKNERRCVNRLYLRITGLIVSCLAETRPSGYLPVQTGPRCR